jgi:CRP/FNR family transcriptional regulator, cyclic AMP receptor protein
MLKAMSDIDLLGDVRSQSLMDLDADLGSDIPADEQAQARRATTVHTITLAEGEGDILNRLSQRPELGGFLIGEGLMLREVALDSRALPELLGPGDVIEPSVDISSFLPVRFRVVALAPTRLAVLGATFARACGHWPVLLGDMERRKSAERQRVAIHGAIAQLPRVEIRLLALLWHLAGTWGRVGPTGVVIPFALTHEMLGLFVGAERPTVTLAVGQLDSAGLLARLDDKTWLLPTGSDRWLRNELGHEDDPLPSAVGRARQIRGASQHVRDEARATRAEAQQARNRRAQLRGADE